MFYFTPLQGFFSPFPHGTRSLSVNTEYLAWEDGRPAFRQGFSCPPLLTNSRSSLIDLAYGTITRCGAAFQPASTIDQICNSTPEIELWADCRITPRTQRLNAYTYKV